MRTLAASTLILLTACSYSASSTRASGAPELPPAPPAAVLAAAPAADAITLGSVRIEEKTLWPASCESLLAKEAGRQLGANAVLLLPPRDLQARGAVCAGTAYKLKA